MLFRQINSVFSHCKLTFQIIYKLWIYMVSIISFLCFELWFILKTKRASLLVHILKSCYITLNIHVSQITLAWLNYSGCFRGLEYWWIECKYWKLIKINRNNENTYIYTIIMKHTINGKTFTIANWLNTIRQFIKQS